VIPKFVEESDYGETEKQVKRLFIPKSLVLNLICSLRYRSHFEKGKFSGNI